MNSHAIPLMIAAADYSERSIGAADEAHVIYGIVSRRLLLAAATPRAQLEDLYDTWNREQCLHRAETIAVCQALEILDNVMIPEGLLA
jgi:hypothetical protein